MIKHQLDFFVRRVDDNHIELLFHVPISGHETATKQIGLSMTDAGFDLLLEHLIAFIDSEPERKITFAGTA